MKRRIAILLLLFSLSSGADAWWSFEDLGLPPSSHRKISGQAISLIEASAYPDLKRERFGQAIVDATSGGGNDENAHGKLTDADVEYIGRNDAGKFNGGDFEEWWRFAKIKYGDSKFAGEGYNAYYYIALMAHLLQDQAVPAHAANIYHANAFLGVPTNPDNLEQWSDLTMSPQGDYFINLGAEPDYYYYRKVSPTNIVGMLPKTQAKLPTSTWRSPTLDRSYWRANPYTQYTYTGQAFLGDLSEAKKGNFAGGWGIYGGTRAEDIYTYYISTVTCYQNGCITHGIEVNDSPGIAQGQMDDAVAYTAGMLMAVSKKLPPVVQLQSINNILPFFNVPATISPAQPNTIKFTLLDNRTSLVTYKLVVDSIDGAPIISSDEQSVTLAANPDLTSLPFLDVVTKEWNGLLATGSEIKPLPEGRDHTLYVVGKDLDGNDFNAIIGTFKVSGGPFLTVTTDISGAYDRFSGISAVTPAAINPKMYAGAVYVTVDANGSPLAQLNIKRPDGTFEPLPVPPPENTRLRIENPADGRYEATVLDEAGNRTFAAFSLGTITGAAAPEESTSAYSGISDTFGVPQLKFHLKDWYPLEKAELFDSAGTLLKTDELATASADITYSFPDLFGTENFTRDFYTSPAVSAYALKVRNKEGHVLGVGFRLSGGSRDIYLYGAGSLDLPVEDFLSGARVRSEPADMVFDLVKLSRTGSGPLLSSQYLGYVRAAVLTGDKADFSDAVEKTLFTRGLTYGIYHLASSTPPPQNCEVSVTPEETALCRDATPVPAYCHKPMLCHSDTIMPAVELKRYARFSPTVYPAELTGIFSYFCLRGVPDDPYSCEGYLPELELPGALLKLWGVNYADGHGGLIPGLTWLSGGLRAALPAGNNVTVKLADWLSLTFETVTSDSYVEAALITAPSLPGVLPLRTLSIRGPEGAYTGNMRVTLKYDAPGLTAGQLNFMEALKVNDAAMRDLDRLPVSRAGQTVVFNTGSLGDFMLEVPSYPEPYQYASAGFIGTSPELGVLAGAPVSVTPVAPGSQAERDFIDNLARRALMPAGNAYVLGPTGEKFAIAAAIRMVYDKAVILEKKFREGTLGIYQVSEDGTYLARLGNMVLNTAKGELSGEVSELHSIFVIAGSTYPAPPAPLSPDVTVPVSNLAFGVPAYENGGLVMISSASPVFVDAYDPQIPQRITSEVSTTYYLVDEAPESCTEEPPLTGPPGTCLNPVYKTPFTLSAGIHTIWYGSDDGAGNKEIIKNKTLYVDADAPLVTAFTAGQEAVPGVTAYMTETDSVTLVAVDQALTGPVSGVGMTVFDVSTTPCTGFMDYPQSPGDCRKILYTGAFSLPVGTHTVYYSAMDNVGNAAAVKSVTVNVERAVSVNFYPAVKSVSSVLWQWELVEGATGYQVFSSTGGAVSGVLTEGASQYLQAGLTPNARYSNFIRTYGATVLESTPSEAVTLANSPEAIEMFNFGQAASLIIGQPNFVTTTGGTTPNKLNRPRALSFDKNGALWVSDRSNNRVLKFSKPFVSNMPSDLVIGQKDFYSKEDTPIWISAAAFQYPSGLDFDADGNLWVSDNKGRVLRFAPPFFNGMNASMAIGVDNIFSTLGGSCAQNRLGFGAWGEINFDKHGALWVGDFEKNRVMRFSPPFSTGMNANLVLGKPNFTTCQSNYPYTPSASNLTLPLSMGFDSKGNVWVADYNNDRVLKYAEPFYSGMPASVVLGQRNFVESNAITGLQTPNAASLKGPSSLEFDGRDNLYIVDSGNNRVLKYQPPLTNGMDAALVLGQNDFNSMFNMNLQATFNFPLGVAASGFAATDEEGRLWVADTYGNRVLMFEPARRGIFTDIGFSYFTVNWLANNNSANTLYFVEISPSDDFSSQVAASGYISQNSFAFTNLPQNSSYYVRVKAKNLEGMETAYKTLGFVKTKENTEVVSVSTETVNGNPEAVFTAYQPSGIVLLSTTSATGAVVLAKASADGLTLASNLYEIGPEGTYAPPASITFYYSEERLAGLGLQAGDIAVYEHFADLGWVKLPDQNLDTLNNRITVPVTRIASVFGIFGIVKDRLPPVTEFSVAGSSWSAVRLYISMRSSVSLSAFDPIAYGTSNGVAFTEFSTDLSTSAFSRYSSPFVLPEGYQRIEFRSSDNAGNIEEIKSKSLIVDATPPLSESLLAGTTGQNSWYVSPVEVRFVSTDSSSGVGGLYYFVNASSFSVYASSFPISAEGRHVLGFYSVDNVLNAENISTTVFSIDSSTPVVSSSRNPIPNLAGWNNTPVDVVFTGTDTVSGIEYCSSSFTITSEGLGIPVSGYCTDYAGWTSTVSFSINIDTTAPSSNAEIAAEQGLNGWFLSKAGITLSSIDSLSGAAGLYYSVDGSSFALYSSSFAVSGEGAHLLKYYSMDRAGNKETEKELVLKLDLDAPLVGAVPEPDANIYGWNNTAISVVFSGTDTISGLAYCETAKVVDVEGSSKTISGYCSDYAGWSSTATLNINIDITAPAIDYLLNPLANTGNWNSSPVNVLFRGSDTLSGIVECSSIAVAGEGKDQKVTGWCRDLAGNIAYATATLNIDLTRPLVSADQAPASNASGWNNGPVDVNFTGADALSGIAYCEPVKTASLAGASQTVTGYCMDYAGLSSTATYVLSIDTAAPLLAYSITPANNYGWNNSDVTISFDCSDDLSGIAGCPGPVTYPAEGINISTSVRALDLAGNYKDSTVSDINIDKTAPASTAAVSGIYRNGWYSSTVEIILGSTDALSGVKEIYYSLDGGDYVGYKQSLSVNSDGPHEVKYYAVDKAGNIEAMGKAGFKIDRQAPVISHILNPAFNTVGWNNSAVSVVFTGTDAVSGVEECSSGNVAQEGTGQEIAGWCRDFAGNISYTTATINIDLTVPQVSVLQTPERNAYGWNNTPVTAVFSGTDAVSGIAYCSPAALLETEGSSRTLSGHCADYAGWSSTVSLTVNIDTTAPSLSYAPEPAANLMGWNNSDVLLKFTCADGLSGVKACPAGILLAGEGVNISTSAAAFDLAGNIRYTTATLKIDRTPPVITISSPAAGQVFIATRGDIGVKFGVTDNLDPAPASGAWLEQVEDRGSPRGARPARLAVANGQPIEPLDIDDGSWRLIVSATDFADNAAQLTGGAFEVIHDVLAPRTSQAITAGPSLTVGATTYITSAARLELTSIDDLVSANDGIGLGVKDQPIRVKSGGSLVKELLFANPAPKQGEAFISTVTGAGLGVADGVYGLAYNASDVLGNIETEKSVLIGLDNTAPASSAELAGTAGGNGWHISTVTISLLATDALSGVAGISYGLDNGAYLAYTSPVETATEGQRTVRFYARDRLGNTEAGKSMDFKIDRTPPVVIATITPAANAAGWHSGMVKAGFSGNDAVSGIAYCEPARTMRAEGRGLELSGYCRDQAGLTSTATAKFNIDLTSPTVVVERAPLANMRGWNNTDVKVTFTCADALSGIKSCPSAATLAGEGAGQGASGTAADYADNSAAASIGGIHIDKTAPASSLSVFGDFWESGSDKYLGLRSKLSLAAADGLGGVEAIEYRIDEAPFGIYSSSFSLLEGIRTIHYRATDKADNTEAAKTALYRVDGTAPVTTHHIGSPYHAAGGVDYITPTTPITFTAEDPVSGGVHSEVSRIEVSLDGSAFSAYTAALKFSEGRHTIKYRAVDNVGNTEVVRSTVIYVDGTKPITELSLSGDQYKSERQYISRRTDIVIAAADPVVNDVSVGVKEIKYAVDGAAFSDYSQFKLDAEGRRLVSFYSADHVNNVEVAKTAELWVDGTAPLSILDVLGGKQYPGAEPGSFYASLATKIRFVSVDPGVNDGAAGVKAIEYVDNGGAYIVYAQPISLGEGNHTITYRATDRVENTEVFGSTQVYIDNTAPVTSFSIAEPLYIQDGVRYITPASALTFSAIDPLTKEVAAGVERIETAVDGGHWLKYTQALKFAEGRHIIKYRAIDNVGNTEAEKTLELRSDDTPPASKWRVNSGDSAGLGGRFYLNTQGKITLESADPVVAEVTSGLEGIYYGIDSAPADKYSAPLGLAEGIRTVNFSARDNVGNTEVAKSTVIYVDGTGPVSGLTLTGDQYHGDKVHISTRTGIVITSVDPIVNEVASGLKETKYSVDGGLFVNYSLFRLSAEGKRLVSYYSADYVANTETVKTTALWVDNTPPSTELTVAGARYTAPGDGKLYITGDSGIVITSWDSISNDTTSGMLLTKYRIDNGGWQVYSGSFTVAAEGPHTLEYYALDRVQNAEPLKTINLAVDNTPPVTEISLGEPKSEVFALPLLTPSAKITLSALDPVVNGAASGLNSIFYEIKNMRTGALTPVTAYLSPFTMPGQGTFSIRYWSKDNTGNTETPREQIAAVTTWLEDGLAAVSGLEMSGTADISGAVKSNAVVSLSGNARILGDVTASTITLNGKAQITGLQVLRSPSIDPESIILDGIIQNAQAANKNDLVADYLAAGKLVLGSKTGITLTTGTYYFKGMELSGGASIAIAGKVDILVEGGITINGGGSINASDAASRLTIIVSTSAELKFSGGAALAARVYAPYSELKLAGNALLGGHYFVKRAIISGAGNILQAGESLPVAAASPGGGPKTKAAAMPSGSFGILAGPDPAFRLGEVYVFPNPAKGGEAPVFHIETGIADTVKITIYTISGRAAHEHTLTGMPAELDDGNGLSYAYEYVWRGHIPSGVYLYYIEAQKAGQKLKKTGKFSVVR